MPCTESEAGATIESESVIECCPPLVPESGAAGDRHGIEKQRRSSRTRCRRAGCFPPAAAAAAAASTAQAGRASTNASGNPMSRAHSRGVRKRTATSSTDSEPRPAPGGGGGGAAPSSPPSATQHPLNNPPPPPPPPPTAAGGGPTGTNCEYLVELGRIRGRERIGTTTESSTVLKRQQYRRKPER